MAVLLALCWLVGATASASAYHVQTWTTENGLPQNIVVDACQTPDGYLWLATFNGLVRFDGVRFSVFDHSNTRGILGNQFNSVTCTPEGEVWAAARPAGVTRFSGSTFQTYGSPQGLPPVELKVTGDAAGHIWTVVHGRILRWDLSASKFLPIPNQHGSFFGTSDASGASTAISGNTLQLFCKGRLTQYQLPDGAPWRAPIMAALDVNGTLWISDSKSRIRYLSPGQRTWSVPLSSSATSLRSRTFTYSDGRGGSWPFVVSYKFGGVLTQTILLPSGTGTSPVPFNNVFKDRNGSLWVASNGRGLAKVQKQLIATISKPEGLPDGDVYPLFQDHTGDIWIGGGGLARYHAGKVLRLPPSQSPSAQRVTSIGEDRDGMLWVATFGGLYRGTENHFRRVPTGYPDGEIAAIYQDPVGPLWLGTSHGLYRFEDGHWSSLHKEDGLASNDVRVLLRGPSGDLWIGGYGGVTRFRNGQFQQWTEANGLPSSSVRALYEDMEGVLWIGTYDGGLARLANGKLTRYTVADGLFSSGVFQVLDDGLGYFWMTSNRGIYRVAKRELDLFARGDLKVISSVNYGKADGMRNDECNGGFSPAGIRARDGKLWFPTQDGVAIVDPATVQPQLRAPPVVIESLTVDRASRELNQFVRILPGQDNVEITYTAPSLVDPEQIRFRYQIAGLDHGWVLASTRRTAYYAHLPAGEYDFKVTAAIGDGAWNDREATIHLSVLPPFYQTPDFFWLIALTVVLALVCAWRLRTLHFERATARQQAISGQLIASQENERMRIAAELHDSLGQHLLLIKNWAALALQQPGLNGAREPLREISESAAVALQEVREISYNLRPVQLERLGLTTALKDLIQQVAGSSSIDFTGRIAPLAGAFPQDAEISIFRICQESLNNIVRHSHASQAMICIDRYGNHVDIVIRDNGRGFNPAGHREVDAGTGGLGLLSLAERVRMLGGTLAIVSSLDTGTTVSVTLPSRGQQT